MFLRVECMCVVLYENLDKIGFSIIGGPVPVIRFIGCSRNIEWAVCVINSPVVCLTRENNDADVSFLGMARECIDIPLETDGIIMAVPVSILDQIILPVEPGLFCHFKPVRMVLHVIEVSLILVPECEADGVGVAAHCSQVHHRPVPECGMVSSAGDIVFHGFEMDFGTAGVEDRNPEPALHRPALVGVDIVFEEQAVIAAVTNTVGEGEILEFEPDAGGGLVNLSHMETAVLEQPGFGAVLPQLEPVMSGGQVGVQEDAVRGVAVGVRAVGVTGV